MNRNNASPDQRLVILQEYAAQHPDAVITPHVIEQWNKIQYLTQESCRDSFTTGTDQDATFDYMLQNSEGLLPDVFIRVFKEEHGLEKWDQMERYLSQQGLTPDALDFFSCGGEALVFTVKGAPDIMLKVSSEYKMPTMVPYINKPFSKAVFPMSQHEKQDHLHAVEEYDATNVDKNEANSKLNGTTGQISVALTQRLPGYYTDIFSIGKADKVSYDITPLQSSKQPPQWALDIKERLEKKLKASGDYETIKSLDVTGKSKWPDMIQACHLSDGYQDKHYELSDIKYKNFGCAVGFENLPLVLDKRCVKVVPKPVAKDYGWNTKRINDDAPAEYSDEYGAYYRFLGALRETYHEKYGAEDKAFKSVAKLAKEAIEQSTPSSQLAAEHIKTGGPNLDPPRPPQ